MLWRSEHGLQTHFDEDLSHPADRLAAYELDRATGDLRQPGLRAAVETGWKGETFENYPTCFGHTDALAISSALKLTQVVKDIVATRSENRASSIMPETTKLGLRVRIFPYPEGTCACWVMVAATHFTGSY